jgi:hypothetical protein
MLSFFPQESTQHEGKTVGAVVETHRSGETHHLSKRTRGTMRGTIAGKGDVILDAAPELNSTVQPAFEINECGSHTLQSRDFEDTKGLRASLIEATVQAIAEGSGPRLRQSRLWL